MFIHFQDAIQLRYNELNYSAKVSFDPFSTEAFFKKDRKSPCLLLARHLRFQQTTKKGSLGMGFFSGTMAMKKQGDFMCKSSAIRIFLMAFLFEGIALVSFPPTALSQSSPRQGEKARAYITREVRHEIILLPQYSLFDWIEFEVKPDNTVILRGQVRGLTLKADAEAAVKRIEGVTGAVNQIEDLPPSPKDDRLPRSLYRAIYTEDGPLFRYAIEVIPSIRIRQVMDGSTDRKRWGLS